MSKRIPLLKGNQKGIEYFTFVADPREIIKLYDLPEPKKLQSNQRPWDDKRVKEISKYAAGELKWGETGKKAVGYIPNAPILNIKDRLEIKKEHDNYFIELPTNKTEIDSMIGCIEILDGQHRLIAFHEDYISTEFPKNETFIMPFILFNKLLDEQKKEVFFYVNTKQEKVDKLIIHNLRRVLNLLSEEEDDLTQLIEKLNIEDSSPFRGKISIRGEKIINGLNLVQIKDIFKRSNVYTKHLSGISVQEQYQRIQPYLLAWQNAYPEAFVNNKVAMSKISGLRYMINLFNDVTEIRVHLKKSNNLENIQEIIDEHFALFSGRDFWELNKQNFAGESVTVKFAHLNGKELRDSLLTKGQTFSAF